MFSLEGKSAVVTGAAGGIGLAIARRFRAAGANVIMSDLADASSAAEEIGAKYFRADVSVEAEVGELMQKAVSEYGSLDIAVNNAGMMIGGNSLLDESVEAFRKQFEVNTLSVVFGIRQAARLMKPGAAIVNTGSLVCVRSIEGWGSYTVSKAPIPNLTRQAAVELGAKGIRVNAFCPSTTDTSMGRPSPFVVRSSQFGRIASTEEMAAVVHFLASPDASWINGQSILADGGITAGPSPRLVEAVNAHFV